MGERDTRGNQYFWTMWSITTLTYCTLNLHYIQQPRRTLNMLILQVHNILSPKVLIWFYPRRMCTILDRTVFINSHWISEVPSALQGRVHRLAKSCRLCWESTEWSAQHAIIEKIFYKVPFLTFFFLIVTVFSSLQCWQMLLYSQGFYWGKY